MAEPAVTLTKVGRVALITLNVPSKLNAMTSALADGFGDVVEQLIHDSSPFGCVVVTGAGRAFSAGGDLDWLRLRCQDTPSRNTQIMHGAWGPQHAYAGARSKSAAPFVKLPSLCRARGPHLPTRSLIAPASANQPPIRESATRTHHAVCDARG